MKAAVETSSKQNQSKAAANNVSQQKNNSRGDSDFVDNRPETKALKNLQMMINGSSRMVAQRQTMANIIGSTEHLIKGAGRNVKKNDPTGTLGLADNQPGPAAGRLSSALNGTAGSSKFIRLYAPSPVPVPDASIDAGHKKHLNYQTCEVENLSTVVQRVIKFQPEAKSEKSQSRDGLIHALRETLPWVAVDKISGLVDEVDSKKAPWTPQQAYSAIKKKLIATYPVPPKIISTEASSVEKGTIPDLTVEEAMNYFVSNFKTFLIAVIDSKHEWKKTNETLKGTHAEEEMMAAIDAWIATNLDPARDWAEHSLEIWINNSPCWYNKQCADKLYKWENRDYFYEFKLHFQNMYEYKEGGFDQSIARLMSGGIQVDLIDVQGEVLPILAKNLDKATEEDYMRQAAVVAAKWEGWKKANE